MKLTIQLFCEQIHEINTDPANAYYLKRLKNDHPTLPGVTLYDDYTQRWLAQKNVIEQRLNEDCGGDFCIPTFSFEQNYRSIQANECDFYRPELLATDVLLSCIFHNAWYGPILWGWEQR